MQELLIKLHAKPSPAGNTMIYMSFLFSLKKHRGFFDPAAPSPPPRGWRAIDDDWRISGHTAPVGRKNPTLGWQCRTPDERGSAPA